MEQLLNHATMLGQILNLWLSEGEILTWRTVHIPSLAGAKLFYGDICGLAVMSRRRTVIVVRGFAVGMLEPQSWTRT